MWVEARRNEKPHLDKYHLPNIFGEWSVSLRKPLKCCITPEKKLLLVPSLRPEVAASSLLMAITRKNLSESSMESCLEPRLSRSLIQKTYPIRASSNILRRLTAAFGMAFALPGPFCAARCLKRH